MSGGSFNYLCFADSPLEAQAKIEDLRYMADELEELAPGHPVTLWTRNLAGSVYDPPSLPGEVQRVWRAVEWWHSADWGKDSVTLALRATEHWREQAQWSPEVEERYQALIAPALGEELDTLVTVVYDAIQQVTGKRGPHEVLPLQGIVAAVLNHQRQ